MAVLKAKALKHQYEFINSKAKYTALVSGLGAGKTEALLYSVLKDISTIPNARILIAEPTVDLIKRIIYPRLEDIIAGAGLLYKLNRSEGVMQIWIGGGKAEIIFRSMEVYARLIGFQIHKSYLDELDVLPKDKAMEVWIRVLARTRLKYYNADGTQGLNAVNVTTTPEGFRATYYLWMKAHLGNPEYRLIRGRTMDNHHLPDGYIASLRAAFTGPQLEAYLLGNFVNLTGLTVYDGFDRDASNTPLTIDDFSHTAPVHIGLDANVGKMAGVVVMKGEGDSKQAFAVSEFFNVLDTPAMINAIHARFPNRMIIVYPDSSMGSRKSVDSSKTDIKLLRNAGFRINAPRKNGAVKDRVGSMNVLFKNGENERNFFVNSTTCPNFVEALEKQVYDDNGVPVKDNITDHLLDAAGYAIVRLWGVAKPTTSVVRMRF